MTDKEIESTIAEIWFHAQILDELVDEMPNKAIQFIRKKTKKGSNDKMLIRYAVNSVLRHLKGIVSIPLFEVDEQNTQELIRVKEFLRDSFIKTDIAKQVQYANLINMFNEGTLNEDKIKELKKLST